MPRSAALLATASLLALLAGAPAAAAQDCAGQAAPPSNLATPSMLYETLSTRTNAQLLAIGFLRKPVAQDCAWIYEVRMLTASGSVVELDFDAAGLDLIGARGPEDDHAAADLVRTLGGDAAVLNAGAARTGSRGKDGESASSGEGSGQGGGGGGGGSGSDGGGEGGEGGSSGSGGGGGSDDGGGEGGNSGSGGGGNSGSGGGEGGDGGGGEGGDGGGGDGGGEGGERRLMRVLVVEDDRQISRQVVQALTTHGYVADTARNGEDGRFLGQTESYDAIILDLGLPVLDGLSVLQNWRQEGIKTPVLVLTARDTWSDKVKGLRAGADDYLAKPFHMEELVARVEALIRRDKGSVRSLLTCGDVQLDAATGRVTRRGEAVVLTALEHRLLAYLMHRPGAIVSKAELTEHIYDQDFDKDSNVIEVLVNRLRKKFGTDFIKTRRGLGYMIGDDAA